MEAPMADKTLPFSRAKLEQILAAYPTPFHLNDERGMRENARRLEKVFAGAPDFRKYFAVKGVPEPAHDEGDAVRGLRRGLQLPRRAAAVAAGGPAGRMVGTLIRCRADMGVIVDGNTPARSIPTHQPGHRTRVGSVMTASTFMGEPQRLHVRGSRGAAPRCRR
jgi:hypothetical protein